MSEVTIKNVVLLGGTSIVGQRIVEYLSTVDHPLTITITSRSTKRPSWLPEDASRYKVVVTDYASIPTLTSLFTSAGADAVVSCLGAALLAHQNLAVDAAVEAGVKVFVPSEYAECSSIKVTEPFNKDQEFALSFSLFKWVHDNWKHLQQKVDEGKIKRVSISNGMFFEWGLINGYLGFNVPEKKATIYNGGKVPVDAVSTHKVGQALARILLNPAPYLNRTVHLSGALYTQSDLLRLFEEKSGSKWTVVERTSGELIEEGAKMLETDPVMAVYPVILGLGHLGDDAFTRGEIKNELGELGLEPDVPEKVVEEVLATEYTGPRFDS